jgi:hypothetical protein
MAAKLFGINYPKVPAISKYRLEGFPVERLMRFVTPLNQDVEIIIRDRPGTRLSVECLSQLRERNRGRLMRPCIAIYILAEGIREEAARTIGAPNSAAFNFIHGLADFVSSRRIKTSSAASGSGGAGRSSRIRIPGT